MFLFSDKEPDYRDVTVRTDVKVKDLYDVEERLGTWVPTYKHVGQQSIDLIVLLRLSQ